MVLTSEIVHYVTTLHYNVTISKLYTCSDPVIKLSRLAYLAKNWHFLLSITSSALGQLNINMQSLTTSADFVRKIFLKLQCNT